MAETARQRPSDRVVDLPGAAEQHAVDPSCELCEAARLSPWYHEDELCWIAECEACAVPMVVWRPHGIDPSEDERTHMLARLHDVADELFGDHWLDDNRRSIPGHWHVHARPAGRFNGHR